MEAEIHLVFRCADPAGGQGMELALALDRRTWYNLYERNTIEKFTELYWKENGIGGWEQHKIIRIVCISAMHSAICCCPEKSSCLL